jgi:hypothetical protein
MELPSRTTVHFGLRGSKHFTFCTGSGTELAPFFAPPDIPMGVPDFWALAIRNQKHSSASTSCAN